MTARFFKFSMMAIVLTASFVTDTVAQFAGNQQNQQEDSEYNNRGELFSAEQPALEAPVDPDSYYVGPGDDILVNIVSISPQLVTLRIGPSGDLVIPGVGTINTNGMSLSTMISEVEVLVGSRLINAEVYTSLVGIRKFRVFVYGAVGRPGYVEVSATNRLQDLIAIVGLRQLALSYKIEVTRESSEVVIADLLAYRFEGDIENNPQLLAGDKIYIPFGRFDEDAVLLSGAISTSGYQIIREGETLGDLYNRVIEVIERADVENVYVTRYYNDGPKLINLTVFEFDQFVLKPRDEIQFLVEKQVSVHGYVGSPGSFSYIPGYTAGEYITLAGGVEPLGTLRNLRVTRNDGTILFGESVQIERGDVIEAHKSTRGYLLGDTSVLQIVTSTASILLSAYAILRR